jgi:hypothetical protein
MRVLSCLVLAAALLSTVEGCRKAELPSFVNAKEKNIMETNWEWSKGGVGMIMSPNDANIYVATKSTRNNDVGFRGKLEKLGRSKIINTRSRSFLR